MNAIFVSFFLSLFFLCSVNVCSASFSSELSREPSKRILFKDTDADGLFVHDDDNNKKQEHSITLPLIHSKNDTRIACQPREATFDSVIIEISSSGFSRFQDIYPKVKGNYFKRMATACEGRINSFKESLSFHDIPYAIGPLLTVAGAFYFIMPEHDPASLYPNAMRQNLQGFVVMGVGLCHTLVNFGTHYLSRSSRWKRGSLSISSKMKIAGAACVALGAPLALSGASLKYSHDLITEIHRIFPQGYPYVGEYPIATIECYATNARIVCFAGTAVLGFGGTLWLAGESVERVQCLCKKDEERGYESSMDHITDVMIGKKPKSHPPHIIPQHIVLGVLGIGGSALARYLEVPTYRLDCFTEAFYTWGHYDGVLGYMGSSERSTACMQLGAYSLLCDGAYRYIRHETPVKGSVVKKALRKYTPLPNVLCKLVEGYDDRCMSSKKMSLSSKVKIWGVLCMSTGLPLALSAIPWNYSYTLTDLYCANGNCEGYYNSKYNRPIALQIIARGERSKKVCFVGVGLAAFGMGTWLLGKTMEKASMWHAWLRQCVQRVYVA